MRKINSILLINTIKVLTITHSLFILYTCYFGVFISSIQRTVHLMLILPLGFILFPANKKSPINRPTLLDYFLSALSFLVCFYALINYQRFIHRWMFVDPIYRLDIIFGTLAIILVIELARRIVAPAMALLAVVSIIYLIFGDKLSGVLSHTPFSFNKVIEISYMGHSMESIFGSFVGISASYVSLFILFGAFINKTAIGSFFKDFAIAVSGKGAGGPAKVAVFSSALFGMVSGGAAANVYSTGTFSIPMMKKIGFTPEFSGAVEAAASTGGQYMPPIMGAAAFLMAEITGIPYVKIAIGASISAIIYFFTLYIYVHFIALKNKHKLSNYTTETKTDWKNILSKSYLFAPILFIFVVLILGYSTLMAGFSAIIVTIVIGFISKDINLVKLLSALENAGKNTIMVAVAVACAGIIIGGITHTGLGLVFLSSVLQYSQGNILIVLFMSMITCMILGMGMPTSAAYIMAVTLTAPVLLELNVDIMAAHLFCFYFAIFAAVTPPVAICAYAAANIAQSDPTKTGIQAFKLAISAIIIPYAFVYNNSLLAKGPLWKIVISVFFALLGMTLVVKGLSGYFSNQNIGFGKFVDAKYFQLLVRICLILLGICFIFIPYIANIV